MLYAAILSLCLALVVATCAIHYEVLRAASLLMPTLTISPRQRTLVAIAAAFLAHFLQIGLYALVYWVAGARLGYGRLTGALDGGAADYLYFSAATFTTLGIGDVAVEGPLRLLAGVESLNGLVLITWSASFTYLSMEKFWTDHRRAGEKA